MCSRQSPFGPKFPRVETCTAKCSDVLHTGLGGGSPQPLASLALCLTSAWARGSCGARRVPEHGARSINGTIGVARQRQSAS